MTPLQVHAQRLRETADECDSLAATLAIPKQSYTLEEAANKLYAVLGSYVCITPAAIVRDQDGFRVREYDVWDGKKHFLSHSLAEAVNACLAAHAPGIALLSVKPPTVESVQAVMDQATEPF
jgi:hypothetical protein